MVYKSFARTCFNVFNYLLLAVLSLSCVLPFVHILALSFSSSAAEASGNVGLWPVEFTTKAYQFILEDGKFFRAFFVTVKRVLLGVPINLVLTVITAYALSKEKDKLVGRNFYMAYFFITTLIGGGTIPLYLTVSKLGLLDSMWSLVLPGALSVHNMIIMMNFIRGLPEEMEEAAFIDGAGPMQTLVLVMLPVLKPGIATIALFNILGHWNGWFDGMIYMSSTDRYPLQTYLRMLLKSFEELMRQYNGDYAAMLGQMNARTGRSAQLFLALVPIMIVYPFLQKYFTKGLIIGSVKG